LKDAAVARYHQATAAEVRDLVEEGFAALADDLRVPSGLDDGNRAQR
jgi:hypothetical protein